MKIAINGFGRIGRNAFRVMFERGLLERHQIVAVNDLVPADNLAYLLKYDSVMGRFPSEVSADGDTLKVGGHEIKVLNIKEGPTAMPWSDMEIDLVLESTGAFTKREAAAGHIYSGAKRVLITAPSADADETFIIGVNDDKLDLEKHLVVALGSCTTNAASPVMYVLEKEGFGIEAAYLNTTHAYTAKQSVVDSPSAKDFRNGRAAAVNMIPTSTGAAEACAIVQPALKGIFDAISLRVPAITGSIADITFITSSDTSYDEILDALVRASESYLEGIMKVTFDPIVSTDIIGESHSSIVDADAGRSLPGNARFFKLMVWYDNEWGFSHRLADMVERFAARME